MAGEVIMKAWLADFRRQRDAGLSLSRSFHARRQSDSAVFTYDIRHSLPGGLWKPGHVRAALLSAARDRKCLFVRIPLAIETRDAMTHFYNDTHTELVEGGFAPDTFTVERDGAAHSLTASLFTEEETRVALSEQALLRSS